MNNPRLQDDLVNDFIAQRKFIEEHIKMFDPIAESLSRKAAQRLVKKGLLIILEVICYLLCIGTIVFAVCMHMLRPFNILANLMYDTKTRYDIGPNNIWFLNLAVYGFLTLIALLFYFTAQNLRAIRLKNNILNKAGKNIKILVGQLLKRKAAIDTIQQRYFTELPDMNEKQGVNDIPNPGYDDY
jgi:hypothetical protein